MMMNRSMNQLDWRAAPGRPPLPPVAAAAVNELTDGGDEFRLCICADWLAHDQFVELPQSVAQFGVVGCDGYPSEISEMSRGCELVVVALFVERGSPGHHQEGLAARERREDRAHSSVGADDRCQREAAPELLRLESGDILDVARTQTGLANLRNHVLAPHLGGPLVHGMDETIERPVCADCYKDHRPLP